MSLSLSMGGPLDLRGTWNLEGGLYTGDFERWVKEGSRNGHLSAMDSIKGNLEGEHLY
jgi:hypothetical protein